MTSQMESRLLINMLDSTKTSKKNMGYYSRDYSCFNLLPFPAMTSLHVSNFCRKIIETTRYIIREVEKIEGIYVMGNPEVSVIAIGK